MEAKAAGAEVGNGAYVARVMPDAPGAKAGIRAGDVVVAVGDRPVHDPDDVIQAVQATPVGEKVPLTVLRKGTKVTLTMEVARRPAPKDVLATRIMGDWWRGMRIEPLTPELRTQTGLKESDTGVFVREVRDGSPAAQTEIIPGMVIDQVGEKKVAGIKDFEDAIADVQGPVMVHILGIGVKVIQPPGAEKDKGATKAPSERPKGKRGGARKPAEKAPESKPLDVKPDATPEGGSNNKPADEKKDTKAKP